MSEWFPQLMLASATLIGIFWLIVLPYRLSKALIHKWGYHAYCGISCEFNLQAAQVAKITEEKVKRGMRDGMRSAATFGPDGTKRILKDMSFLPVFTGTFDSDDGFDSGVKLRYEALRGVFDVEDETPIVLASLAIALGASLNTHFNGEGKSTAHTAVLNIVGQYAGLSEPI